MIHDSILDLVGDTPLLRLSRLEPELRCQLVAKVEYFSAGGSIKDRVALRMIEAAERDGSLQPGGTIVEPTSGNTGTGLAIAARLKGYQVIAVMPDKMSTEKMDLLRALGAEVVVCPTNVDPDSEDSYYRVADRLTRESPGGFQPNQYHNPANPQTHYDWTGPEIWEQTAGRITHFVAGVGTGGTISGCAKYLKGRNPDIEIIGADPVGSIYSNDEIKPYLVEGVGEDFWPTTFDPSVVDRYVTVSDEASFLMTRRLATAEGLLVGGSCGMAAHAALQVALGIDDPDALVVVVLPDGGRAYLSKIFNDAWMRQHGFLPRATERTVGEVMVEGIVTVRAEQTARDAVKVMHDNSVSQLAVTRDHHIVGSLGERGLLRRAVGDADVLDSAVMDVMEAPFESVTCEDTVLGAMEKLAGPRSALTVMRDGKPVGIVTRSDLLEAMAA